LNGHYFTAGELGQTVSPAQQNPRPTPTRIRLDNQQRTMKDPG
jgi:hypothetical protein